MDLVKTLIPIGVSVGLGGWLVSVLARGLWAAGQPREVACPDDGCPAEIELDRRRAAVALFAERPHRVARCSRWPCDGDCTGECTSRLGA